MLLSLILGHFWCSVVTSVTLSSNHKKKLLKNSKKFMKNIKISKNYIKYIKLKNPKTYLKKTQKLSKPKKKLKKKN